MKRLFFCCSVIVVFIVVNCYSNRTIDNLKLSYNSGRMIKEDSTGFLDELRRTVGNSISEWHKMKRNPRVANTNRFPYSEKLGSDIQSRNIVKSTASPLTSFSTAGSTPFIGKYVAMSYSTCDCSGDPYQLRVEFAGVCVKLYNYAGGVFGSKMSTCNSTHTEDIFYPTVDCSGNEFYRYQELFNVAYAQCQLNQRYGEDDCDTSIESFCVPLGETIDDTISSMISTNIIYQAAVEYSDNTCNSEVMDIAMVLDGFCFGANLTNPHTGQLYVFSYKFSGEDSLVYDGNANCEGDAIAFDSVTYDQCYTENTLTDDDYVSRSNLNDDIVPSDDDWWRDDDNTDNRPDNDYCVVNPTLCGRDRNGVSYFQLGNSVEDTPSGTPTIGPTSLSSPTIAPVVLPSAMFMSSTPTVNPSLKPSLKPTTSVPTTTPTEMPTTSVNQDVTIIMEQTLVGVTEEEYTDDEDFNNDVFTAAIAFLLADFDVSQSHVKVTLVSDSGTTTEGGLYVRFTIDVNTEDSGFINAIDAATSLTDVLMEAVESKSFDDTLQSIATDMGSTLLSAVTSSSVARVSFTASVVSSMAGGSSGSTSNSSVIIGAVVGGVGGGLVLLFGALWFFYYRGRNSKVVVASCTIEVSTHGEKTRLELP